MATPFVAWQINEAAAIRTGFCSRFFLLTYPPFVGGASAKVDGYLPNPYGYLYFSAPVLPANNLVYTVPPAPGGTNPSVPVTTASGTVATAGVDLLAGHSEISSEQRHG